MSDVVDPFDFLPRLPQGCGVVQLRVPGFYVSLGRRWLHKRLIINSLLRWIILGGLSIILLDVKHVFWLVSLLFRASGRRV